MPQRVLSPALQKRKLVCGAPLKTPSRICLAFREEYFGLRIRHKTIHSRAINIPVNSTVGPSGWAFPDLTPPPSPPTFNMSRSIFLGNDAGQECVVGRRAQYRILQEKCEASNG